MKGLLSQSFHRKLIGLLFLGVGLLLLASPGGAAYLVTGLEVSRTPRGAAVTVEADAPLSYSYFTIGEPDHRLVVDFSDAVHGLPKYRFGNLETQLISGIRTSQYRPYPQPSVRIVLDMPRLVPFKMKAEGNRLVILLESPSDSNLVAEKPVQMPPPAPIREDVEAQAALEKVEAQASSAEIEVQTLAQKNDQLVEEHTMTPVSAEDTIASGEGVIAPHEPEKKTASQLLALGIRKPVSYNSGGRRDPFVQLPGGQEVEFGQAPLPNVERLTIVGILLGPDGYRALAQDNAQNGYVLRKGDRVLHGYVAQIDEQRVVFRLDRRGLDRTIILRLPQ